MRRGVGAVLLVLAALPAHAQENPPGVRVGVEPAVVTVGEPFQVVVEALGERGGALALEVALDTAGPFEATGARGSDPAAGLAWVTLVAWRTGPPAALTGTLRVSRGGARAIPLRLAGPVVRSVLPGDTVSLPPRPARDVIGPDRAVRWPLVAAGALAALLLLAYLARRRRRPVAGSPAPPPLRDARAEALRALERVRREGLLERGEVRRFLEETAEVVRWFAAARSREWSRDLTTDELLGRLRAAALPGVSALAEVLGTADLAKFAAHAPTPEDAAREWEVARAWVAEGAS